MALSWSEHITIVSDGGQGYPVVEVLWADATAYAIDWADVAETLLKQTLTVGYLVAEDDHVISIVSLINESHIGHGIVISKDDIIWWRDLT